MQDGDILGSDSSDSLVGDGHHAGTGETAINGGDGNSGRASGKGGNNTVIDADVVTLLFDAVVDVLVEGIFRFDGIVDGSRFTYDEVHRGRSDGDTRDMGYIADRTVFEDDLVLGGCLTRTSDICGIKVSVVVSLKDCLLSC